jgi:hypothetical protein
MRNSSWVKKTFAEFCESAELEKEEFTIMENVYISDLGRDLEDRFTTVLNESLKGLKPFSLVVSTSFPLDDERTRPVNVYLMENYQRLMTYVNPRDFKAYVNNAFLNSHWMMIYKVLGSHPYFLQSQWYSQKGASRWGWDHITGSPVTSIVADMDRETGYYSQIDGLRFEQAPPISYYKWQDKIVPKAKIPEKKLSTIALDVCYTALKRSGTTHQLVPLNAKHQPKDFHHGALFRKSMVVMGFNIPENLWNAYLFAPSPFQSGPSLPNYGQNDVRENYVDCRSLIMFRIFKPYDALLTIPNSDGMNQLIGMFSTLIQKFFATIAVAGVKVPLYAETLLREALNRFWTFSYGLHRNNREIARELANVANTVIDLPEYTNLCKTGKLGRALDFFTEMLSAHLWSRTILCIRTIINPVLLGFDRKINRPAVLLQRLMHGPTADLGANIETIDRILTSKIKILQDGLETLHKKAPEHIGKFAIRQVYNPADNYYYTALVLVNDIPNVIQVEALAKIFQLAGNLLPEVYSNPMREEQDRLIQQLTSAMPVPDSYIVTEAFGIPRTPHGTLSKDILGDPDRLLFCAPFAGSILPRVNIDEGFQHQEKVIKTRSIALLESDNIHADGETTESAFRAVIFSRTSNTLTYSTFFDNVNHFYVPAPGVIFVMAQGSPVAAMFHTSIWPSTDAVKSFLKSAGIQRSVITTKLIRNHKELPQILQK